MKESFSSNRLEAKDVEYIALFVDSQQDLLLKFPARRSRLLAHHSTIWYKPENLDNLEIGKKSSLKIIGYAYDECGFALLVENLKSKNKFPHITISCAADVPAVYSNELLNNANIKGTMVFLQEPVFIGVTEGYKDHFGNIVLE